MGDLIMLVFGCAVPPSLGLGVLSPFVVVRVRIASVIVVVFQFDCCSVCCCRD